MEEERRYEGNAGEPEVDAFGPAFNLKTLRTCSKMLHFATGIRGRMGKVLFSERPRSFPRINEAWNSRHSCETVICLSFSVDVSTSAGTGETTDGSSFHSPPFQLTLKFIGGRKHPNEGRFPLCRLKDEIIWCFHVYVQRLSDSLSFTPSLNTAGTKFPGETVV